MYIYVLGHRDGRFGDVYIRPVAVNGLILFDYHFKTKKEKVKIVLKNKKKNLNVLGELGEKLMNTLSTTYSRMPVRKLQRKVGKYSLTECFVGVTFPS